MENDGVLYTYNGDTCILKLVGAVKYTTVASDFEGFVDDLVVRDEIKNVIIDMRDCTYIDSTDLGILARITVSQMKKGNGKPELIYTEGSDIASILQDVGFSRVFNMVENSQFSVGELEKLESSESLDQVGMAKMMLAAHELLIDLDEGNKEKFSTVVEFMRKNVDDMTK